MNGALLAVGAGLLGGLGYVLYKRASAAAPGASACETACAIAATASGVSGGQAACASACGIWNSGVGKAVTGVLSGVASAFGDSDPRGSLADILAAMSAKCPPGTHIATGSGSLFGEHRFGTPTTVSCVDASGKAVGTVETNGTFHAYDASAGATPPAPVRSPSSPIGGWSDWNDLPTLAPASGGVTVTTTPQSAGDRQQGITDRLKQLLKVTA